MRSYMISYVIYELYSLQRRRSSWRRPVIQSRMERMSSPDVVCADDAPQGPAQAAGWLEYPFRKSDPILRCLLTKLAAWIADNFGQELGIPPKSDAEWNVLNAILENNLVPSHGGKGQLRTFCCNQWECELYSGRPKACTSASAQ